MNHKLIKHTFNWLLIYNFAHIVLWGLGKFDIFSLSGYFTTWDMKNIISYFLSNCFFAGIVILHFKVKENKNSNKQ